MPGTEAENKPANPCWPLVQNEVQLPVEIENPELKWPVVALPPGWTAAHLKDAVDAKLPQNIARTVEVYDNAAFIEYLDRFKVSPTITASMTQRQVRAVLDDHADGETRHFAQHVLLRKYEVTRAFARWFSANRSKMTQVEFALFLEENLNDVISPDSGTLMKLVLDFKAFRTGQVSSAIDLRNGDVNLTLINQTKNETGSVVLPEHIVIRLVVFEETEWDINARLKYRVDNEKGLFLWFELVKIDDLLDQAFQQAISDLDGDIPEKILFIP